MGTGLCYVSGPYNDAGDMMTPRQFHLCLDTLRLSQRSLAPALGCSEKLPRLWAMGTRSIPPVVAEWLDACVRIRQRYPDPEPPAYSEWRRPPGPQSAAAIAEKKTKAKRKAAAQKRAKAKGKKPVRNKLTPARMAALKKRRAALPGWPSIFPLR